MNTKTIDAMKQALDALNEAQAYTSCASFSPSMTRDIRAAADNLDAVIKREEAQTVEPVWASRLKCDIGCTKPEHCRDADQCTNDWEIVRSAPPVKPPLSTERKALIADHQELNMGNYSAIEVEELNNWANNAHDMLAADAQEIDELKKKVAYEQALGDTHFAARSRLEAQQVVVPQGWKLVPVAPTGPMLEAMNSSGWIIGCYRAMLSAAPQPPQAGMNPLWLATHPDKLEPPPAERVPEADLSDGEIYSRISKAVDARLNVRVPMTEAEIVDAENQAAAYSNSSRELTINTARRVEAHHNIREKP